MWEYGLHLFFLKWSPLEGLQTGGRKNWGQWIYVLYVFLAPSDLCRGLSSPYKVYEFNCRVSGMSQTFLETIRFYPSVWSPFLSTWMITIFHT